MAPPPERVLVLGLVALGLAALARAASVPYDSAEETAAFWRQQGLDALTRSLQRVSTAAAAPPISQQVAKNVIIFIGDGMGVSTTTAARIYKGQKQGRAGPEGSTLAWERFPSIGLFKTYNVDKQVPDSAGTATAMFSGVKSRYYMLGLEARAQLGRCHLEQDHRRRLPTIMDWAQASGKHTGFVTTTRVTHATPAALYAHINHRDWECDTKVPADQRSCVDDIARQLVESHPGKGFKVILGGGLKQFGQTEDYGAAWDDSCVRADGRDLVASWSKDKARARFVRSRKDLLDVSVQDTDHLLGLFSPGHMPYALQKNVTDYSPPSLAEMTTRAIQMLSKGRDGYVLLVEGGRIDHAHHANMAHLALDETLELEKAVEAALRLADVSQTLIVVAADHSHAFTINGYPARGADVLGFADDENKYETLTYATGPGAAPEIRGEPGSVYYRHFAPTFLKDAAHGGEDIVLYATGPLAQLFTGVFEQNYMAHAVSYAACTGPLANLCPFRTAGASSPGASSPALLLLAACALRALHAI
ncbi:hypothetical protein ONE63_004989 [Megalurothrips usitatus]|uniref:Alkaline phosphatase n=1 Tax=Megalurothrips usitatus TaxID=439358 RepID=A0AAV7X1H2_9NEOP|nr:hypothetical protein ONE63_004989 [Megalurothrips usitatus]